MGERRPQNLQIYKIQFPNIMTIEQIRYYFSFIFANLCVWGGGGGKGKKEKKKKKKKRKGGGIRKKFCLSEVNNFGWAGSKSNLIAPVDQTRPLCHQFIRFSCRVHGPGPRSLYNLSSERG